MSPEILFEETERPPQEGVLTAINFQHHKLAGFDEGCNGWAVNFQKEIEGLNFLVFSHNPLGLSGHKAFKLFLPSRARQIYLGKMSSSFLRVDKKIPGKGGSPVGWIHGLRDRTF